MAGLMISSVGQCSSHSFLKVERAMSLNPSSVAVELYISNISALLLSDGNSITFVSL